MRVLKISILLSVLIFSFTTPVDSPLITTKWYLKCQNNALPHTSNIIHVYKKRPSLNCSNYWEFDTNNTLTIHTGIQEISQNYTYPYAFSSSEKKMTIDGIEFRISKINEDEIILSALDY